MPEHPKPLVLVILDGWGERAALEHNAMASARLPVWDALMRDYPHGQLNASELFVGLPAGQMGNSEVGHMNIGSGRVLMQELPKIDAAVEDGSLEKNPALIDFIKNVKASFPLPLREGVGGGAISPLPNPPPQGGREPIVHLMGLLSPGGVHSHQAHMAALANILSENGIKVAVHAFLDGRDTPPKSALEYVKEFEKAAKAPIATVSGRYYAMDRDKRWDRVQKAYDTLASAKGEKFKSAADAIEKSYAADKTDEFVLPCVIGDYHGMKDGDGILMANFRADRAREILTALLDPDFKEFPRKEIKFSAALGMVEYSKELNRFLKTLFPPQPMAHIFGEIIAEAGLKQLRIAETEKYAHVTFFFNGGREQPFAGEERVLVPSPKVATYDLKPEMSAYEVTDKLLAAIASDTFDVIVVNYANADMVGHTGDIVAATKAVEAIDACLGKLTKAVLARGGALVITADHGNAEQMFDDETHQPHTAHTLNVVPVIIVDDRLKGKKPAIPEGKLADIAPTLLKMLGLPQPSEMTGTALI